jgi:6-phosphogluconate dehydrogenase (decarboxylating)
LALAGFAARLDKPRNIWIMVPAAAADRKAGDHITVGPRSVIVLENPRSGVTRS